ncbi:MAG: acyl-CoA thioesterase [Candidatus Dormibacteria bacterium]
MFIHQAQMRFGDIDLLGHVNHARYLAYLEDAHLAFLTSAEGPALSLTGVIIAHWEIDYVRPATLASDPLRVSLWVNHVGRSSFALGYTIDQAGDVAVRASSVIVAYDYAQGRARQLTPAQRAGLERWRGDGTAS